MNTILKTAIFVTALLMLGGCATKALTPEEQAFQDAQRSWHRADQLHDRAGAAIHGAISSRGATISNGAWKARAIPRIS